MCARWAQTLVVLTVVEDESRCEWRETGAERSELTSTNRDQAN